MIRVVNALQSCPPLNAGARYGYLEADGTAQNLLPYAPGHLAGDLMVGFLPWSCQSGYYGDLFQKYSTPPGTGNDEVLYRFLDGTEGTVPQNGRTAHGLMGAEYGRPPTDILTGILIRGADPLVAPTFPLAGAASAVAVGDGTYIVTRTTPSFVASGDMLVVCSCYVGMTDWDTGDPDYAIVQHAWSWYGTPPLDPISESKTDRFGSPASSVGWRVTAKAYLAGATVPAISNQVRANASQLGYFEQSVACFAADGSGMPGIAPVLTASPAGSVVGPDARLYSSDADVVLTASVATRIAYTLDGSEPSTASQAAVNRTSGSTAMVVRSTAYAGDEPIHVPAGGTLRFRAIGSPVATTIYDSDTEWHIDVPTDGLTGTVTFDAVSSTGEVVSTSVVIPGPSRLRRGPTDRPPLKVSSGASFATAPVRVSTGTDYT